MPVSERSATKLGPRPKPITLKTNRNNAVTWPRMRFGVITCSAAFCGPSSQAPAKRPNAFTVTDKAPVGISGATGDEDEACGAFGVEKAGLTPDVSA